MIGFICKFCNETFQFEKVAQCGGHARSCKFNPNLEVARLKNQETQKRLGKAKHIEHVKKYTKPCLHCGDLVHRRFQTFCSKSCSAAYHNLRRVYKSGLRKIVNCIDCNNELRVSKNCNPLKTRCNQCKIKQNNKKIVINNCIVCNKEFNHINKIKTCSIECKKSLASKNRSNIILKLGTSNFKTKQENFTYKIVKNIKCDSRLEKAAIIWLVDYFKVDKLERFHNILNFYEDGVHRTFNPDFYVKKNNEVYIAEVKMKWITTSKHPYNRTIPLKKKTLQNFCDEKGYKMIWLDFDYDPNLKMIYKQLHVSKA